MKIALDSRLEARPVVGGRRLLLTIAAALAAGAAIGSASFFALQSVSDSSITGLGCSVCCHARVPGCHALPAFLFGLAAGWLRLRTGSTLNTWFVHVPNNVLFLSLGRLLLK